MNPEQGQQISITFSEKEHALITAAFKDNEPLLKALRALLLGLNTSEDEKKTIQGLSPEVKEIICSRLNPQLDRESSLSFMSDQWLGVEQDVRGHNKEVIYQAVESYRIAIELLEKALGLLNDPWAEAPSVAYDPSTIRSDVYGTQLLARNKLIRNVTQQIFVLHMIANQKKETPTQVALKAKQNSSQ